MRAIRRFGFQPMNPFQGGDTVLGTQPLRLGAVIDKATRDSLLSKIQVGTTKLQAIRAWIDTKIYEDPMLLKTFGQQYVADNFWGYMDLARGDQWYVDQAQAALQASSGWNLDDETLNRTNDWISAVNIAYDAVKQYGKVDPITLLPGPATPAPTAPATPSVTTTPPPASGPSVGTIVTIGAAAVAGVVLLGFLFKSA